MKKLIDGRSTAQRKLGVFMNLKPLLEPKTMAVIGVSATNERHPANVIYDKNNHRYPVEVFAVNPKGGRLHDEKLYSRIIDLPGKIDLAVIAVRAEFVPDVVSQCIKAGVKSAAVISGGFTEGGRKDLQDKIVDMSREANFPFIGPNSVWVFILRFTWTRFFCRSNAWLSQT